jgi:hypothetical protein
MSQNNKSLFLAYHCRDDTYAAWQTTITMTTTTLTTIMERTLAQGLKAGHSPSV